jgi:hypothetical protein
MSTITPTKGKKMKKIIYVFGFIVGVLVTAGLVKYGVDTYTKSHKSRESKLIDTMHLKPRK